MGEKWEDGLSLKKRWLKCPKDWNIAEILCSDFQPIISDATRQNFIFLDPPYSPGCRELKNAHYVGQEFNYDDQRRLEKYFTK